MNEILLPVAVCPEPDPETEKRRSPVFFFGPGQCSKKLSFSGQRRGYKKSGHKEPDTREQEMVGMARFELATFCPPDAQTVTKMTSK